MTSKLLFLAAMGLSLSTFTFACSTDAEQVDATEHELRIDNGDARFVRLAETTPSQLVEAATKKARGDFPADGVLNRDDAHGLVWEMMKDEDLASEKASVLRASFAQWVRDKAEYALTDVGQVDPNRLRDQGYYELGGVAEELDLRSSIEKASRGVDLHADGFASLFIGEDTMGMDPVVTVQNRDGLALKQISGDKPLKARGKDALAKFAPWLDDAEFREPLQKAIRNGDIQNVWLFDSEPEDGVDQRLVILDKKNRLYVFWLSDC